MDIEKEKPKFKRIEEKVVYENMRIILYDDRVSRPDGQLGTYIRLTYHGNPKGAVIIPKLSDGRILLMTIHRYAVDEESIELPRGGGHPEEKMEDVAYRELKKETGLVPKEVTAQVGIILMSPLAKQ